LLYTVIYKVHGTVIYSITGSIIYDISPKRWIQCGIQKKVVLLRIAKLYKLIIFPI